MPDTLPSARLADLRSLEVSYAEVGETRSRSFPTGFRSVSRTVRLPDGTDFQSVGSALLHWRVQRNSGVGVVPSSDLVEPGGVADLMIGIGRLALRAPVKVVYVINEPGRCGFAYGTLPGHPEAGEESFVLEQDSSGSVSFTVSAFSRPLAWYAKLAGPAGHLLQAIITSRYLRAFGPPAA